MKSGRQTIVEARLRGAVRSRRIVMRVPYFSVAMLSVAGTDLVATVPRRLAAYEAHHPALRVVAPPRELTGFRYLKAWHPRVERDGAHQWLRATLRRLGATVNRS